MHKKRLSKKTIKRHPVPIAIRIISGSYLIEDQYQLEAETSSA